MLIRKSTQAQLVVFGLASILGTCFLPSESVAQVNPKGRRAPTLFDMEGVQVLLPETVTATKREGPDFLLYYFTLKADKNHQVLFAYVGNFPSFPNEAPKGLKEQQSKIGGRPARTLRWKDKQGKLCRETLVEMGKNAFPAYAHFAYAGLTKAEATSSDSILATVRSATPATSSQKSK